MYRKQHVERAELIHFLELNSFYQPVKADADCDSLTVRLATTGHVYQRKRLRGVERQKYTAGESWCSNLYRRSRRIWCHGTCESWNSPLEERERERGDWTTGEGRERKKKGKNSCRRQMFSLRHENSSFKYFDGHSKSSRCSLDSLAQSWNAHDNSLTFAREGDDRWFRSGRTIFWIDALGNYFE